jgi:hypothetical protein
LLPRSASNSLDAAPMFAGASTIPYSSNIPRCLLDAGAVSSQLSS